MSAWPTSARAVASTTRTGAREEVRLWRGTNSTKEA
jgi:hypothetical protein